MTTPNRGYNEPEAGETDWHIPVNQNWNSIDADMQDALDGGGTANLTDADGIDFRRQNVGAMTGGTYHSNAFSDGGFGVVFEAAGIHIESVVVDSDLSGISNPDLTVELRQYESGADDPTIIDTETVTLTGGPERIVLDWTVPDSQDANADANDEYVIQRGPENTDEIPLRRRWEEEGDWSAGDYEDHAYTDPSIDFLKGTNNASSFVGDEPVESWYYFFDWLVGPEDDRVTSPWSTDVDEIYMRPRDPTEEFDDVSPRALWIDTSE